MISPTPPTRRRPLERVSIVSGAAVMLLAGLLVSCSDTAFSVPAYKKAIQSGRSQIPEARQMEELWGDVDHSISYHGARLT